MYGSELISNLNGTELSVCAKISLSNPIQQWCHKTCHMPNFTTALNCCPWAGMSCRWGSQTGCRSPSWTSGSRTSRSAQWRIAAKKQRQKQLKAGQKHCLGTSHTKSWSSKNHEHFLSNQIVVPATWLYFPFCPSRPNTAQIEPSLPSSSLPSLAEREFVTGRQTALPCKVRASAVF